MTDPISRSAAIEAVCDALSDAWTKGDVSVVQAVTDALSALPSLTQDDPTAQVPE